MSLPPDRITLGKAGEDYACFELERQGYEILARRFRTRLGEIDIVAREGDTLVFIEVKLERTTLDVFEQFAKAIVRAPEVLECPMVAGGFDYLVKTRVADMEAYRHCLGNILWALPGVRASPTYAVMEEIKSTAALPV